MNINPQKSFYKQLQNVIFNLVGTMYIHNTRYIFTDYIKKIDRYDINYFFIKFIIAPISYRRSSSIGVSIGEACRVK